MNFNFRFLYPNFLKSDEHISTEFLDRQLFTLKITIYLTFAFKVIFLILNAVEGHQSPYIPTNAVTIIVACIPAWLFLQFDRIIYAKFFAYFPTVIIQALSAYYVILEKMPYGNAELSLLAYIPACILLYRSPIVFFGIGINFALFVAIKLVRFDRYMLLPQELVMDLVMSILAYTAVIVLAYLYKNDFVILKKNNDMLDAQKKIIELQAEDLKNINSTKDKLFAILSHDLRSPVASLKNYMMLLDWGALSQVEFAESAQGLNVQLSNVNTMLDNVLNWSISQMGGMKPKIEKWNISIVIEEEIALIKPALVAKNIKLDNQIPPDIYLMLDKNHWAIILRNLLQNAVKFTHSGGIITLKYVENSQMGEIIIQDNGIGMSENSLKNIFLIGKTTTQAGTSSEQGTGLGLVLVKELVAANNGKITVTSELKKGTIFEISFPKM